MAIYRAVEIIEEETEPLVYTRGLHVIDNEGSLNTSIDGSQIMPCYSHGYISNLFMDSFEDNIYLFEFLNSPFNDIIPINNFVPIENTLPRTEDLKIKQVSIRGVVDIIRYDRVG